MIRSQNAKIKNKMNIHSININITVQASSSKTEFQILLNLTLEDTSMYFSVIYTETPCLGTIKFVLESSLHFGS